MALCQSIYLLFNNSLVRVVSSTCIELSVAWCREETSLETDAADAGERPLCMRDRGLVKHVH